MAETSTGPWRWPAQPYKGLGYYDEGDVPIFAGREQDVIHCARLLGLPTTRSLILHGPTGCGKSSFLRAALIPELQGAGGFRFLREDKSRTLLISSTYDPLSQLGQKLYEFASADFILKTPRGETRVDLSDSLAGISQAAAYADRLAADPTFAVDSLAKLVRVLPGTLVLVVDQAEEVLTLRPGPDGQAQRANFFGFLHLLNTSNLDLRLLLSMRTEFYGRFVNEIHWRDWEATPPREYFLAELGEIDLRRAIEQPTSEKEIPGYGTPHEQYGFSYEAGLAARIARDLQAVAREGGVLPVMQIVCGRLVARTRESRIQEGPWVIHEEDYRRLGGVADQIAAFVSETLRDWCRKHVSEPDRLVEEVERWRETLFDLVRPQPDGSVTTELRSAQELIEGAEELGCEAPAKATLEHLAAPDRLILRPRQVYNPDLPGLVPCYSLGHDAIGLALTKWKIAQTRSEAGIPVSLVDRDDEETALVGEAEPGVVLCLSGGGYRAMLFHVGALWRLNEAGLLPKLARISCVSAGSIVGAALGRNWQKLDFDPATGIAREFRSAVERPIRKQAGETIDDLSLVFRVWFRSIPDSIADRLASLLGESTLQDLPQTPQFIFSATNVQSGALWRFSRSYMADYRVGRVLFPRVPLRVVVAASSAVPPVFSPFRLKVEADSFEPGSALDLQREPFVSDVFLTDGSVYDNLGLEAAWKRYETVLVSDGGLGLEILEKPGTTWVEHSMRVIGLLSNSMRLLRRRQLIESYAAEIRQGSYWGMDLKIADFKSVEPLPCPPEETAALAAIPARMKALEPLIQERLINWGYAVCDASLRMHYLPDLARPQGFPYPKAGVG